MKLNSRHIGATFYTEYTIKPGETLKQIAREQLRDENRANDIFRLNNGAPELKPITETKIIGWVVLIPEVAPALLVNRQSASQKLNELRVSGEKGLITAETYYEQRKLIVAVL